MISRRALGGSTLLTLLAAGCSRGSGSSPESGPPVDPGRGDGFPVTLTHAFGTTTVEAAPQRVVTIGFNEQDFALALGVEPVGVREFLGYDAPNRPWAPEAVRGKQIPTVGSNELELETIAALEPDLILGIHSYIDRSTYDELSKLAPTLAQTADWAAGATPWDQQALQIGTALGRAEQAQSVIDEVRAQFEQARTEHPEFADKQAVFVFGASGGVYHLGGDDYRSGWLTDLGMVVDPTGGEVSLEKLADLDRDVLVAEGLSTEITESEVFTHLKVVREGRYAYLGEFDQDFAAALGFNSPLSLPFLLEVAVPRLAAATDGDPDTVPQRYPG